MKITHTTKIIPIYDSTTYTFQANLEDKKYLATIWMNESLSKFQDWEVTDSNGDKVDSDIEDEIIEYIDDHWETLTNH